MSERERYVAHMEQNQMRMTPNSANHNPRPEYIRALIDRAGISQREAARRIGVSERMMRYYVSLDPVCFRPAPYTVQLALELMGPPGLEPGTNGL